MSVSGVKDLNKFLEMKPLLLLKQQYICSLPSALVATVQQSACYCCYGIRPVRGYAGYKYRNKLVGLMHIGENISYDHKSKVFHVIKPFTMSLIHLSTSGRSWPWVWH